MHREGWSIVVCAAALSVTPVVTCARVQEPATPSSPSASTSQTSAVSPNKPNKKKYSHVNDFLIRGTVFNDRSLSFPGVQLRIRRAGEKKFRWESYTNSRGEFAVRIPRGSDYEMVIRAKGFAEQTRTVDAKNGENEKSMVFRMQPEAGEKK